VPEANCNPWSGRSYACLSKEENFNFSEYILQYLPTRFNKSRTQDVNSSNDAIKNLKFPVPWPNFIQQPTRYMKSLEQLGLSKLAGTQF
jgi:hypothetical protein